MLGRSVNYSWALVLGGLLPLLGGCGSKARAHRSAGAPSASGMHATLGALQPAPRCDDPDPVACFERAKNLDVGSGGQKIDKEAAIALYTAACSRQVSDACAELGNLYFAGEGSAKEDQKKAAELYAQACAGGSVEGCVSSGGILSADLFGIPVDKPKAQAAFEKALSLSEAGCEAGKLKLCEDLAFGYERGIGSIAASPSKAGPVFAKLIALSRKACDAGDGLGCYEIGYLHFYGKGGMPEDKVKAVGFFERGCAVKHAQSCFHLGLAYQFGRFYSKDLARAIAQFEQACTLGDGEGCNRAAFLLSEEGPQQDLKRGFALMNDGCVRKDGGACNDLGVAYAKGEFGVTKDPALALANYRRGCNFNSSLACKNAREYSARMDAEKAADEFRKTLKVGSDSHCGLVIEVKPPIAKVQTMIGEVWLKIEQLYAQGKANCRFRNGVYQDPN
jgi:TPR repeat protein